MRECEKELELELEEVGEGLQMGNKQDGVVCW